VGYFLLRSSFPKIFFASVLILDGLCVLDAKSLIPIERPLINSNFLTNVARITNADISGKIIIERALGANIIESEFLTNEKLIHLRGPVKIKWGGKTLFADEVLVHTYKNDFEAAGNVRVLDGGMVLTGEVAYYSGESGVLYLSKGQAEIPPYFYWAKEIKKKGDLYELTKGSFSPCRLHDPHISIDVEKLWIYPGKKIVALGARFRVGHAALFFLPVIYITREGTGQYLSLLNSRKKGLGIQGTIPVGKRMRVFLDHYETIGDSVGGEGNLQWKGGSLFVGASAALDKKTYVQFGRFSSRHPLTGKTIRRGRGRVHLKLNTRIPLWNMRVSAEALMPSDRHYKSDFGVRSTELKLLEYRTVRDDGFSLVENPLGNIYFTVGGKGGTATLSSTYRASRLRNVRENDINDPRYEEFIPKNFDYINFSYAKSLSLGSNGRFGSLNIRARYSRHDFFPDFGKTEKKGFAGGSFAWNITPVKGKYFNYSSTLGFGVSYPHEFDVPSGRKAFYIRGQFADLSLGQSLRISPPYSVLVLSYNFGIRALGKDPTEERFSRNTSAWSYSFGYKILNFTASTGYDFLRTSGDLRRSLSHERFSPLMMTFNLGNSKIIKLTSVFRRDIRARKNDFLRTGLSQNLGIHRSKKVSFNFRHNLDLHWSLQNRFLHKGTYQMTVDLKKESLGSISLSMNSDNPYLERYFIRKSDPRAKFRTPLFRDLARNITGIWNRAHRRESLWKLRNLSLALTHDLGCGAIEFKSSLVRRMTRNSFDGRRISYWDWRFNLQMTLKLGGLKLPEIKKERPRPDLEKPKIEGT